MGDLGHKFRLQPVQNLHRRDIRQIDYSTQTFAILTQNRSSDSLKIFILTDQKFICGV